VPTAPAAASADWVEETLAGLRASGLRNGGARRAVVEYLGSRDCCSSAQEIFDGIRARGGSVGIASVYRILDTLSELRHVQRVDFGDSVTRYEAAPSDGDHHHHLVCTECGKVEAFSDDGLESALERVAGRRGYCMETHEVVVHGACGDCRTST
jgi:Fur family transcriptional regulator, ferric uptake regulator